MFTFFRYGLIPVVLFCGIIAAGGADAVLTNTYRKSTWPQTVVTVVDSKDFGQMVAEQRGTRNSFPDPHGVVSYVVDGKTYTWRGRARDIGLTAMTAGEQIEVYYNPQRPQQINTMVLLGAGTGSIIMAAALAFLSFYVWFFWIRGFLNRSTPPDDMDGRPLERGPVIVDRPMGPSFNQVPRTTFGKR